ncbi:MAG: Serine-tRNA ligase [Candidatus Magasanikbacteria bacterium GW2011_GWC2_45_8]|uniref:Serine-tRNA ligase n=1 Tax=Candidatus Magasanikbacteria bacterium GW2011_GWC2_45_8 TaxID=1619050 RepID=A0A0G1QVU2_9BACT|nr:MAG: Serine-tRNA ligase [Candidatus Magasanikbacteria bacterium GW2011_GWC2_45_8]
MLDIKYIRENVEEIKRNNASRNVKVDIDLLLKLDKQRRDAQLEVEAARAELKKSSKQKPSAEEITRLRTLGEKTQKKEGCFKFPTLIMKARP